MAEGDRFVVGQLVRWLPFDRKRAPGERNAWRVEGWTETSPASRSGSLRASHADDERFSVVDALKSFEPLEEIASPSRLDRDALLRVRKIVVHENSPGSACPDGTASAIILHDALPCAEIIFASHGRPSLLELSAEPGLLFCDITPPREKMREFVDAGAFVLDHHEHQHDVVEAHGERGVYGSARGVSGAVLALMHVWRPIMEPTGAVGMRPLETLERLAVLAGVRDTWQKNDEHWGEACAQAEGLRFWSWERLKMMDWTDPRTLDEICEIGRAVLERSAVRDRDHADSCMRLSVGDLRVAVVPTTDTSDVSELVDSDVLVGFKHRWDVQTQRPMLILSMRSRAGYDVGRVASWLGGGGHKAAAGAQLDCGSCGPYEAVRRVFEVWLSRDPPPVFPGL